MGKIVSVDFDSCDVESGVDCGLHGPAVVVAAKLITQPCALIGAPQPWLTTEALSVGGNERFSPITTAIGIRETDPLV